MAVATRQRGLFVAEDWKVIYRAFTEVNFSAYDFDTIRAAMVDYIRINFPEDFNDWIESSEFVAIIELLAYLGQSLAFRTDLNTRENFLDTAERRDSVLKLARMLSFNASRNISATGLVKLDQISTTQSVIDSNGTNLSNKTVRWNDANNPDWFEQFILILNSVFVATNPFGKPSKDGFISDIKTQLYTLNNDPSANRVFPYSSIVNNETLEFEIVNPDFTDGESFFERAPDPTESFNIIFRNDGDGNASPNTGFFLLFKQGTLLKEDFDIEIPIENRSLNINGSNINNSDVFVHEINENGFIINKWEKVPTVTGNNVIFNSIDKGTRNIFNVVTRPEDQISIRFADGRFGDVPTGIFRVWYRESANARFSIKPENMRSNRLDIPYFDSIDNSTFFLSLTFSLQEQVTNSAPSQTTTQIKQVAPQAYYVQNRMVNGEDYNVFPLRNAEAAAIKATNRIHSGFNRHIDINDPTGQAQNVNLFGEDGLLYQEENNKFEELPLVDGISDFNDVSIVEQIILPLLGTLDRKHFFYFNYPRFEPSILPVAPIAGITGTPRVSGLAVGINDPIPITSPATIKIDGESILLTEPFAGFVTATSVAADINGHVFAPTVPPTVISADLDDNKLNIQKTGGVALVIEDDIISPVNSGILANLIDGFGISAAPTTYPARVYGTFWRNATNAVNSSTGRLFTDLDQQNFINEAPIKIGDAATAASPEFHMGEGSLIKFNKAGWVSIVSISGVGNTILPSGDGAVRLSENVDEEDYVELIILRLRTQFNESETLSIVSQLSQHNTFGLRYDVVSELWIVITGDNIAPENDPFSFDNAGSDVGTPIDSSWLIRAEFSPTNWRFITRGLDYVYESDRDMRFFFSNSDKIVDTLTGRTVKDFIKVLNVNSQFEAITTSSDVDYQEVTPCDGLGINYIWNIEDVFKESDGFSDPRRLRISFTDIDEDGVPDDPTIFEIITSITGNGSTPATNNINLILPDGVVDETELMWEAFTNGDGFQEFRVSSAVIAAYNSDPGDFILPSPNTSLNPPSVFGATNSITIEDSDVIYFRDTKDFYRKNIGADTFELVTGFYRYRRGRNNLLFQWKHFAPTDNRIDPAITNIIDIYVLTVTYDTEIRQWIDADNTTLTKPVPPTNEGLASVFVEEIQNKMISDEISWHPVRYKLLFGTQADETLRARFKVTKVEGTSFSDGEIKSGVIGAINTFFAINNFDFGETFYYTELAAFIHQSLATQIGSVVIVPLDEEQKFGDLFQVRSEQNEVFISSAKVSDVQIVTSFNENILRIGN